MALKIISADARKLEQTSIKGVIFGRHGVGKTSLLWTLPADDTLFIDIEAGGLAVDKWHGAKCNPATWEECIEYACIFGGPDIAKRPDQKFSQAHYDYLCAEYPDVVTLRDSFKIHFWDSISVASRLCFQWAGGQPEAVSDKTGAKNTLGIYGLVGREIVDWLTHIQHTKNKTVWVLGGLDATDDFTNPWKPQIEGAQGANKLPGIFDEVLTMAMLPGENGADPYRAFVTSLVNPWKYPAKDRSGCLEMVEPPHLGNLIKKIEAGKRLIKPEEYSYQLGQ